MINTLNLVFKEHMDFKDRETLQAVSAVLMESDQNQLLVALTGKLYEKIQQKADKIDFSSISRSRGDIEKIENYESLTECIDIIHSIVEEYKQDTAPVDTVIDAIENIKKRDKIFKKAFTIESNLPMMVYNNICLAIVTSVSFLIATCIEYIKNPGSETFQMSLDTVAYSKTKDNLLFESLAQFNKACNTRELDDAFETIMQVRVNKESAESDIAYDKPFLTDEEIEQGKKVILHDKKEVVQEGILTTTITKAFIFVSKVLISLLRTITYYFFNSKQKVSDYFAIQADLLEMNAYKVQYDNTIKEADKKKIFEKQIKIANKFRNVSNKFSIDYTTSKKSAIDQISKDTEKVKASDLDYNPNDETSSPFISALF